MKVRDVLTGEVEDVALGGKALARVDGRVVFVDRGLSGDRVTARVTKTTRRSAEARLVSVEVPSPARVPARCPHVDRCGGCRFQELPYPDQLQLKERQGRETLRHLGGFAEPPARASVAAPPGGAARSRELPSPAQLQLRERRVRETLRPRGGFAEPPVRAIVPAPARS